MNKIQYASPLYILRDRCAEDFYAVLKELKDSGFDGVEFLGLFGHPFAEVKGWMDELELLPLGDHVAYKKLLEEGDSLLKAYASLGCKYLTVADVPLEGILQGDEKLFVSLEDMIKRASDCGLRLQYHNHDQELIEKRDGVEALEILMDRLADHGLCLEIDLGWAEIGGASCEKYLKKYKDNCPVIHLKDYYSSDNSLLGRVREFVPARGTPQRGSFEFRPTGFGVLNLPKLMPLCLACKPEWFVMDHDLSYERDPFEDLRWSLEYVKRLVCCEAHA